MRKRVYAILLALLAGNAAAARATRDMPVVVELYTSQGCATCPAADERIKQLAARDEALLPLFFHVDYWNGLQWKDTYSSPDNTERQKAYSTALNADIFTPQLVVDGAVSVFASNDKAVNNAVFEAKLVKKPIKLTIAPAGAGLVVTLEPLEVVMQKADIWEVRYDLTSSTPVKYGENGGRTLESINDVTHIKKIGSFAGHKDTIAMDAPDKGGVAVLVQLPENGRIIGAASYVKH